MPFFYAIVVDNIRMDMVRRELKEVADYISNTFSNLYFLVNSTNCLNVSLKKELIYLPSAVENSVFTVNLIDGGGGYASKITAYLKDKPAIAAEAWISPGLKVSAKNSIESGRGTAVAGCNRTSTGIYIWIGCE
jgi:hypothetical protein